MVNLFPTEYTQAWRFRHSQCIIRVHLLSSHIRAMIPSVAAIMTRRDVTTPATIPPTVLPLSLVSSAVEAKLYSNAGVLHYTTYLHT